MSQSSASSTFQALFDTALKDYKDKTGVEKVEAARLEGLSQEKGKIR